MSNNPTTTDSPFGTIDLGFNYFRSTRYKEELTCYIKTTSTDSGFGLYRAEGSAVLDFDGDFKIDFVQGGFYFTRKDFSHVTFSDGEGVRLHLKEPFRGAMYIECQIRINISSCRDLVKSLFV